MATYKPNTPLSHHDLSWELCIDRALYYLNNGYLDKADFMLRLAREWRQKQLMDRIEWEATRDALQDMIKDAVA